MDWTDLYSFLPKKENISWICYLYGQGIVVQLECSSLIEFSPQLTDLTASQFFFFRNTSCFFPESQYDCKKKKMIY